MLLTLLAGASGKWAKTPTPGYLVRRTIARVWTAQRQRRRVLAVGRSIARNLTVTSKMTNRRFATKNPVEKLKLAFDFSNDLPTGVQLSGTPTVSIEVENGTETSPSLTLNGAATLDATLTMVVVPVQAGAAQTDYRVSVIVGTTDSQILLELDGTLPVRL